MVAWEAVGGGVSAVGSGFQWTDLGFAGGADADGAVLVGGSDG